ncbi:hypothetical protein BKA70DRAFT_1283247 [Coprinopsis sp. MPI-PUGE-AT-0042]|nr:hypothetical protein BKA70DRAFT_1283247 [Coprinopsis sp. MPI-PUGE-AT-0042]
MSHTFQRFYTPSHTWTRCISKRRAARSRTRWRSMVVLVSWEPQLPGSSSVPRIALSLERMKLDVTERFCETLLSPLAAAFFKDLRYLDIEVLGGYTFNYLHQHLLANSHNLEALRVGYRDLGSSDWNHRILLLPSNLQQTSVSPKVTKLTLEARNIALMVDQRSYEILINAYLSHNMFRNLIYLELKTVWYNRDTLSPQAATPDPDWGSVDGKLSDEEQFLHLKIIHLAFKEAYWYVPSDMKDAIQNGIAWRRAEKLQQVRNAFSKTQRRGVKLDFNWETDLGYW